MAAQHVIDRMHAEPNYTDTHRGAFFLTFLVGAAACFLIPRHLNGGSGHHRFAYIPMEWFGPIWLGVGILASANR